MDASAYLRKQGWRGDGHSLDRTNRGIRKPLLVSKKVDVLGLGTNQHAAVSDQWWLRAFDQGLKNLGTGKESVLASVQKHGINRGGLYGRFVQGEDYAGSIGVLPGGGTVVMAAKSAGETGSGSSEETDSDSSDSSKTSSASSSSATAGNKRKRKEGSTGKRARQKMDEPSTTEQHAKPSDEITSAKKALDPEKEAERRKRRQVKAQADGIVLDAQRRGIIPLGPNEVRKGITAAECDADTTSMPTSGSDNLDHILRQIVLKGEGSAKGDLKAQKHAHEKMMRDLRRAAKAHVLGEKMREDKIKEGRTAKKDKKKAQAALKTAEAARKGADRMTSQEERSARKREIRANKAAQIPELSDREAKKAAKLARREERGIKAPANGNDASLTKKKAKEQRKIEAREAFTEQILWHSRNALQDRTSGSEVAVDSSSCTATINGIANVPLVKVETVDGQFKKGEVSSARTVARRIQRLQKREDRAKKGKGKGNKKRERAANNMERNEGFLAPIPQTLVHVAG